MLRGRRDEGEFRVVRELLGDELVVIASTGGGGPTMRIFCKRLE